jgi:hypothetical protein
VRAFFFALSSLRNFKQERCQMNRFPMNGFRSLGLLTIVLTMIATPVFAEEAKDEGKFTLTPYGRIELDLITSNRNTNPLDPGNFNGYATAAGSDKNGSSTFSPRWTVLGLKANRSSGDHNLSGIVELDFFGDFGVSGSTISPRLRLANITYAVRDTSLTVGQDWLPVMALLTDNLDFSILGYGGNLWQRLPQVTLRQKFGSNLEGLVTAFRNERGFICCGQGGRRPVQPGATPSAQFDDPRAMPYFGTRLAYTKDGWMSAVSAAYRYYRSAPGTDINGAAIPSGLSINSYLVGTELVVPLGPISFSGELAYAQGLGDEFFRFNQEKSTATGKAIRTVVGWGQLNYSPSKAYTFLAGYGFDNPVNSDMVRSGGVDVQYLLNQRTYLTAIHPIWGGFNVALEWNHLWTEWSTGPNSSTQRHFQGDNYMMSLWYSF